MSTISIAAPSIRPARTATRLRLTTRGRRVLVALAALPLAVGIGFAAISGGSAIASGEATVTASFETVTVMPGDTLWSIAESVAPYADPRKVISGIESLNMLGGQSLQVGQELAIPAEYAD
ncbi:MULTISPECIES: LysM peptidoglycan-binding domain-containing protein [unclassified Microbacterium]|uniref:LysM peptidoglycan-binding domain-containing protein n=1 Tax=unclassified Microbacterium TaxID=2609290 RepID=UPI001D354C67|nr:MULTISPECIES: LysM peptidoglycan-binding domain-containing protein [unclassified Microbacterium]CAH0206562.1 Cell division suppressor protein YneA [Microbacterium sp. Bi121]HWK78907.1 LysM peptidoglycan-binding domain-containing protein [Microbacterium sp.]